MISAYASILDEDKKECFDFAYDMSYAKKENTEIQEVVAVCIERKGRFLLIHFKGRWRNMHCIDI